MSLTPRSGARHLSLVRDLPSIPLRKSETPARWAPPDQLDLFEPEPESAFSATRIILNMTADLIRVTRAMADFEALGIAPPRHVCERIVTEGHYGMLNLYEELESAVARARERIAKDSIVRIA